MRNIKHHRLAVTEWRMGGLFAIVPRSGSSSCWSHCTALQQCCCLEENPCPRGPIFKSSSLSSSLSLKYFTQHWLLHDVCPSDICLSRSGIVSQRLNTWWKFFACRRRPVTPAPVDWLLDLSTLWKCAYSYLLTYLNCGPKLDSITSMGALTVVCV